jgi:hypothetical protein
MKRTLFLVSSTVILACGISFAQAVRPEFVPPPLASASAAAIPAHPSPNNYPGVEFPRIEADYRVTFHFKAPDAQKVQVSINNTAFDMTKGAECVDLHQRAATLWIPQLLDAG